MFSISQEAGTILFYIMFSILFIGIITHILLWPLLTFLTPKKLLNTYFTPPHFTQNELTLYDSFPTSAWRTMIFGWAITLPFSVKKRRLKNCGKVMPLWYKVSLYVLCVYTLIIISVVPTIMLILEFSST